MDNILSQTIRLLEVLEHSTTMNKEDYKVCEGLDVIGVINKTEMPCGGGNDRECEDCFLDNSETMKKGIKQLKVLMLLSGEE